MQTPIQLLDVVALIEDLPERGLSRGQVGTVVEKLAPEVFEVEFNDNEGRTYAILALNANQLIVLRFDRLVYELYGLSEEEIRIVEGEG